MKTLETNLRRKVARLDKGLKTARSYRARRAIQQERERVVEYLRVVREYRS